jgi:hypothetical protein
VFTGLSKQQKEAREAAMLFSETLNVQVPAGLEKIFSKIPGLSGALSGLFKVFAGGAILRRIVEG